MIPNSVVETKNLRAGMIVSVTARVNRTVAAVEPSGWLNRAGVEILRVLYLEGATPEWSAANTAAPGSLWVVVGEA